MSGAYLSLVIRHPVHFAWHWLDEFCRWVAFKLPRRIVYHAYIRLHAYATSGDSPWANKHPSECPWDEAVKEWKRQ